VDQNSAIVAFAGIVCGTILIGTVIATIGRAVVAHRRAGALPDTTVARLDERLLHIEQAVDAIAVEVERVAEAQRFTTKLLSSHEAQRT
jgi:hypothetical protein